VRVKEKKKKIETKTTIFITLYCCKRIILHDKRIQLCGKEISNAEKRRENKEPVRRCHNKSSCMLGIVT